MNSAQNFNYDPKILDCLEALDKKYKCSICDGFLTCARIIECGHAFCSYCLDVLESVKSTCPTCDHSIKPSVPAPQIDKEVEEMLKYCSAGIYAAYQKTKASRIEKQKERTKTLKLLADTIHAKEDRTHPSKIYRRAKNMEEVCSRLAETVANRPITDIIPESMMNSKKARPEQARKQQKIPSKPKSKTGLPSSRSARTNHLPSDSNGIGNSLAVYDPSLGGLDISRAHALFEMYDSLLLSPPDSGGSGDAEDDGLMYQEDNAFVCSSEIETEDMIATRQKIQQEIEFLDKETDEALDLYQFVKKWTNQIKDVALGGKERQIEKEVNECPKKTEVSHDLTFPELEGGPPQSLEDVAAEELWKTSMHLIKRLRGLETKSPDLMESHQESSTLDSNRLSIDPDWDKVEFDMPIDCVSKNMKTEFDEELKRFLDGSDHIRQQRHLHSENIPTSGHLLSTSEGIEFFNKILKCKSALRNLEEQSKSVTSPQEIRSLLPVHEFKEPRASKSLTNISTEFPRLTKSDVWIPEIDDSNYQQYFKMLHSRSGVTESSKLSSASLGSQSARLAISSSLNSDLNLKTPRTPRLTKPSSSLNTDVHLKTPRTPRLTSSLQVYISTPRTARLAKPSSAFQVDLKTPRTGRLTKKSSNPQIDLKTPRTARSRQPPLPFPERSTNGSLSSRSSANTSASRVNAFK